MSSRQLCPLPAARGSAAIRGWLELAENRIGDRTALADPRPPPSGSGQISIELDLPLPTDVLLDWHGTRPDGARQTFSLYHHPRRGLALLWRDAEQVLRLRLPVPETCLSRRARLDLICGTGSWSLRLCNEVGQEIGRSLPQPLPERSAPQPGQLPEALITALSRGEGLQRRDLSVLWLGRGPAPEPKGPWIGPMTPIETPLGPVAATLLKPGDWIFTRHEGALQLKSVRHFDIPLQDNRRAVRLRAPWFSRRQDILVAGDQRIALRGPEIEHLFGNDEILVTAGALVDGRSVLAEQRRDRITAVALETGGPHLIEADGCALLGAGGAEDQGACSVEEADRSAPRHLAPYEALSLLSAMARMRF